MTLTVHHLGISQSERIIFLCEELGLDYKLINHTRDPLRSPASLTSLPGSHTGKAPFIVDDAVNPPLTLSEFSAICEYIIETFASGKLTIKVGQPGFADYIYWFQYCSGSLQPIMSTAMLINTAGLPADAFLSKFSADAVQKTLAHVNERLAKNKWFVGHDNILRWLRDVAARPAYIRAMEKGDPEMEPLLGAEAPEKTLLELGGVQSDA